MMRLRVSAFMTGALLCAASFTCASSWGAVAQTLDKGAEPAVPAMSQKPAHTASLSAAQAAEPVKPSEASTKAGAPAPAKPTTVATAEPAPVSVLDAGDSSADDDTDTDGIAATVNDESISEYEVDQRMALFVATSGIKPSAIDKKRIRGQIVTQLESEKLHLQEAVKKHITVSPVEVDKNIKEMMADNHITREQLRQLLESNGSSEDALRSQITAQAAWRKTVQDEYVDKVNVTQPQVDAEMARYAEGANRPHYLVGEIFLPVDNPEQEEKVRKQADDVANQLQNGASFQNMARQLSQSPSAAAGGDMGWIRDGQLASELNAVLTRMPVGTLSKPVRAPGGYYLLALRERQEPLGTNVTPVDTGPKYPDGSLPLARLLLPLGEHPTKELADRAMKIATEIKTHTVSCVGMDKIAKQMPGAVYNDLGVMKLTDLSETIQKAVASTGPGDTASPFIDEAGLEIIGRCDKKPVILTAYKMPSRDEVEQQLFQEQISAMARRYDRDLKRDADIQVR